MQSTRRPKNVLYAFYIPFTLLLYTTKTPRNKKPPQHRHMSTLPQPLFPTPANSIKAPHNYHYTIIRDGGLWKTSAALNSVRPRDLPHRIAALKSPVFQSLQFGSAGDATCGDPCRVRRFWLWDPKCLSSAEERWASGLFVDGAFVNVV